MPEARKIIALAAACLAPLCAAQSPQLADPLIAAYAKLDSYCARVKDRGYKDTTGGGRELEHCALKDGRYKNVATTSHSIEVEWSDGKRIQWYRTNRDRTIESYGATPVRAAADLPPIFRLALGWYWQGAADLAGARDAFQGFEPSPALSTPALAAYELPAGHRQAGWRLWVSREDGLIRRIAPKDFDAGFEVMEVRLNQAVAADQLAYEAPANLRLGHAVKKHFVEVALAGALLSFGLGVAFWRLRGRAGIPEALALRARGWRFYRRLLAWTVAPVLLVALFAPTGGDMSGAARLIERIFLALGYVYLLGLAGLFMTAAHFAGLRANSP